MVVIVLNEEQARVIAEARDGVELRDNSGRHLGFVSHGVTQEEIDEAKRRAASDEPRYTTDEVLEHLRSLEQA